MMWLCENLVKTRYYLGMYSLDSFFLLRFVSKNLSTDCCNLQSFHMFLQNRNDIVGYCQSAVDEKDM